MLLRTLDRYVFREVAVTWIAVTGVLLIILLANQLTRVLSQAAANDFPREVVLILIALTSAGNLAVVVPIGFFLAIMLGLGRLYHESEMAAIQSCGVGPAGLYRPIAVLGVLVVALLAWLSFFAIPTASARAQAIRAAALREAQFGMLEPGRFRTFGGGNIVFYAERVDDNGILHNVKVFVGRSVDTQVLGQKNGVAKKPAATKPAAQPEDDKLEVWVATRAEQRGAGQAEQTFVLYDGVRYEGIPGSGEFRTIRFSEGGIPIRLGSPTNSAAKANLKTTEELWRSGAVADVAELHWRLATPLMALILMVLAVPLSRLRPRQGRFGKIGAAVLSFFFYYQLLVAGRTWLESGAMPQIAGLWWVHGLALCGAIWLLARESPPGGPRPVTVGA
ncbi:MAG TPA: LPS export ABC transporter permease LptF [Steroidobacteraceae bacterium]